MRPATALGTSGAATDPGTDAIDATKAPAATAQPSFSEIYEAHFDYVWRAARRLGVEPTSADDVVQDVFLVVHRRLGDFEGRSRIKTWLYGITIRVVRDHRRSRRRKPSEPLLDRELPTSERDNPEAQLQRSEANRLLHRMLDSLSDDKREVFVLTELEQLSAPEISELLELNVNTVYTRLRSARSDFERAVARHKAGMDSGMDRGDP